MAEPLSSRILSLTRSMPSNVEDFRWRLDTIENELLRLPQNLCVVLTHTPLTQDGSRFSLYEGKGHRRGSHWKSEGELPNYRLQDTSPELWPFGTDRFHFGVVLSRTSSLLDLAVDAEDRSWLNFGGKCGFYVASDTVRDSLPEGQAVHELTERTIWHYFAENTGDPIPEESLFDSVTKQVLDCYSVIRETCMDFVDQLSIDDETTRIIEELEWPEVMLYLGLRKPGPFFNVERGSVLRSSQAEQLIPWGNAGERHHVFRLRPASVARATWYALEALGRMVHAVEVPAAGGDDGLKPSWDRIKGELRFDGEVIRNIRRVGSAKNVVLVLDTFQESDWPNRVDSPLPSPHSQKHHATIHSLNNGLSGIRFRSDGEGEGFIWETL